MLITLMLVVTLVLLDVYLISLLIKNKNSIPSYLVFSLILFLVSITSWQIALITIRFFIDTDFLHRVAFMGAVGTAYAALNLSVLYPNNGLKKKTSIALSIFGLSNFLIIFLIGFSNLIITGYELETETVLFSNFRSLFIGYLGVVLILVLINFIRRYVVERKSRFYFRYAILGIIFYSIFAFIFNLILPGLFGTTSFTLIGSIAAIIPQVLLVYSLVSTRLYTVKYITGSAAYILLRAAIFYVAFYLIAFFETVYLDGVFTRESYITGVFIALIFSFITIFTERFLRVYFEEKVLHTSIIASLDARDTISSEMANELDINKIINSAIHVIHKNINTKGVDLVLYNSIDNTLIAKWEDNKKNEPTWGSEFVKNLTVQITEVGKEAIVKREADTLFSDNSAWQNVLMFMDNYKIDVLTPILKADEIYGYLAIQAKENQEPYTKEDISLLKNIKQSLVLSLSRAMLHKKVQDFNVTLQKTVEERTMDLQKTNKELQDESV